ncbi:MAG TPA: formylglycine-generating enzyme family protein [Gemmatimonadaceae bacterium]
MPLPRPATLALLALLLAPAALAAAPGGSARSGMVRLPAGAYRPLYGVRGTDSVVVRSFLLDRDAVTRGEFLAFVRAEPRWRRSAVAPLHADRRGYLADWRGDLDAGDADDVRRPVTNVSWHAARAYCASLGKRLPTVHEWEYAAAASESRRDASGDPAFIQRLVSLYAARPRPLPQTTAGFRNVYGVRGLHGLAWEWVEDFNSVLVSDDSRGVGGRDHGAYCASAAIGALDPGNYAAFLRFAFRAGLTGRSSAESLGFRCAA